MIHANFLLFSSTDIPDYFSKQLPLSHFPYKQPCLSSSCTFTASINLHTFTLASFIVHSYEQKSILTFLLNKYYNFSCVNIATVFCHFSKHSVFYLNIVSFQKKTLKVILQRLIFIIFPTISN